VVTIIDGLVAEHRVFLSLFEQIECALPGVKTVDEIALLCRLLEALLHNHGMAETDLAYIALDHILQQQDQMTRLHHDHEELDGLLRNVEKIKDLPKARVRFKAVLDACRAHFDEEERNVFPLIEKALQHETLLVLGRTWKSCADLSQPSPAPTVPSRPRPNF
jgi:hemerythrin-like domain-containing protein